MQWDGDHQVRGGFGRKILQAAGDEKGQGTAQRNLPLIFERMDHLLYGPVVGEGRTSGGKRGLIQRAGRTGMIDPAIGMERNAAHRTEGGEERLYFLQAVAAEVDRTGRSGGLAAMAPGGKDNVQERPGQEPDRYPLLDHFTPRDNKGAAEIEATSRRYI